MPASLGQRRDHVTHRVPRTPRHGTKSTQVRQALTAKQLSQRLLAIWTGLARQTLGGPAEVAAELETLAADFREYAERK